MSDASPLQIICLVIVILCGIGTAWLGFKTFYYDWIGAQHRANLRRILAREPKAPVDDTYRGFLRHLLGRSK